MPLFAQVIDSVVHNIYNVPSTASLPVIASRLKPCGATVRRGWIETSPGVFIDPATIAPSKTVKQRRREAFFQDLVEEMEEDELSVLSGVVNILLAQIAAAVPVGSRTPEFAALLAKVVAIQTRIPKV